MDYESLKDLFKFLPPTQDEGMASYFKRLSIKLQGGK